MLFTEPLFFVFFAVVFTLHWVLRAPRARKVLLLLASYTFYAAWDWRFLSLILTSTIIDFVAGRQLLRCRTAAARRAWLLVSVCGNLGLLGFFKYFNFFVSSGQNLLLALGLDVGDRALPIILPVGISFYTFQTLSYTIDIYRGRFEPTRNFLDFALFVGFFPQLVAGPIVRAREFLPQLSVPRRFRSVDFRPHLTLFLIGFFKKTCVSDNIAVVVDQVFANPQAFDLPSLWIASVGYTIQIYCDFSGYSDMAIATAGLLGYRLPLNFTFPYFAINIAEYWRRWHMSLSYWIRDYLYIPLGGSRGSTLAITRNLLITMALCGLWHGAAWNFVIWGTLHGVALVAHRALRTRFSTEAPPAIWARTLGITLTFYWASLTFVIFRAASAADALAVLKGFVLLRADGTSGLNPHLAWWFLPLVVVHALFASGRVEPFFARLPAWVYAALLALAITLIVPFVPMDYRPFIYFQF